MKSEWYTFVDDDRAKVMLEFNHGMAFLHLTVRKPMQALRDAKAQFPSLKAILRNIGFRTINVIIPEDDEKLYRFESMFGFTERRRGAGNILMSQDC